MRAGPSGCSFPRVEPIGRDPAFTIFCWNCRPLIQQGFNPVWFAEQVSNEVDQKYATVVSIILLWDRRVGNEQPLIGAHNSNSPCVRFWALIFKLLQSRECTGKLDIVINTALPFESTPLTISADCLHNPTPGNPQASLSGI